MNRVQQRLGRVEARGRKPSRMHEIRQRQLAAPDLDAHGRETVEDDFRQMIEIVDDPGEKADIERLLDQTLDNVLIRRPGPEQPGQCDIQHGQCSGQRDYIPLHQPEPAVDRGGEGVQEIIDHADTVRGHDRQFPLAPNMDTVPGT